MSICDHRGPPCVDTQRRVQFVLIHKLKTRIMVLLETLRFQPLVAANWDDAVRKVFVLGWPNVSFRCLGNFGTTNQNRILYAFVPSLAPLQLPLEGVLPEPGAQLYGPNVWVHLDSLFGPKSRLFHAVSALVPSLCFVLETLAIHVFQREYMLVSTLKSDDTGAETGSTKALICGAGTHCRGVFGDDVEWKMDPLGGKEKVCLGCHERRRTLRYHTPDEEPYCYLCHGTVDEAPERLCACGFVHDECKEQQFVRRMDGWELWEGYLPSDSALLVYGEVMSSEQAWRTLIEKSTLRAIAFQRAKKLVKVNTEKDRETLLALLNNHRGESSKTIHHVKSFSHVVLQRNDTLADGWVSSDVRVKELPFAVPFDHAARGDPSQRRRSDFPIPRWHADARVVCATRWEPVEDAQWTTLRKPIERTALDVRWIAPKCHECGNRLTLRDMAERLAARAVWRHGRTRPYLPKENVCIVLSLTRCFMRKDQRKAQEAALSCLALAEEAFGPTDERMLEILAVVVDVVDPVDKDAYILRAMHISQSTYWRGHVLDEKTES
eukprot:GEMP01025405.1.p1 GENE.GEMP01025405.1~~GEMP01025405.1.p1  ORF type:complete len:550 (+),score=122.67 GEMP01025405.1:200-1849(+)